MSRRKHVPVVTFPQLVSVLEDSAELASGCELAVTKFGAKKMSRNKKEIKKVKLVNKRTISTGSLSILR